MAQGFSVTGIQQVGLGTPDLEDSWAWLRRSFGMDVPVFREAAEAPLMTRYTSGRVEARDAALVVSMQGGGGFEVWQYTSRAPAAPADPLDLTRPGIFGPVMRSPDVEALRSRLISAGVSVLGPLETDPLGRPRLWVRDPRGNHFSVRQSPDVFVNQSRNASGIGGAVMVSSDADSLLRLLSVLGWDQIRLESSGTFPDLAALPAGDREFRRVIVGSDSAPSGPFAELIGPAEFEVLQPTSGVGEPAFAGRQWGDQGFIHLCFDIQGMGPLLQALADAGFPATVDSGVTFDMGEAGGRFSYVEDSDGTLIEFVETHRIPVLKALGWYLDLRNRDPGKALPRWMVRAMGLGRRKD